VEYALPVVSFKSLHYAITSDMYALPLIIHFQMARSADFQVRNLTGILQTKLSRFLFHYRQTPNATTGVAPAELLLTRRPLHSIVPHASLKNKVLQQQ